MTAAISIGAFLLLKPLFQTGYINHTMSDVSSSKSMANLSYLDTPQPFALLTAWLLSPRHLELAILWFRGGRGRVIVTTKDQKMIFVSVS